MEMVASSSPSTSYHHNLALAQAIVSLSVNVLLLWVSALLKRSFARRRSSGAPGRIAGGDRVDMGVVLGVMGMEGGERTVGYEEAAALFEEEEASVEEAAAAFRVFDRDGDGFIDAAELATVLHALGFAAAAAAEDYQQMIDAYDVNRDGRIDFSEFVKFMETSS